MKRVIRSNGDSIVAKRATTNKSVGRPSKSQRRRARQKKMEQALKDGPGESRSSSSHVLSYYMVRANVSNSPKTNHDDNAIPEKYTGERKDSSANDEQIDDYDDERFEVSSNEVGSERFGSFSEAYDYAKDDSAVLRIFGHILPNGEKQDMRWIRKYNSEKDQWDPAIETALKRMSEEYRTAGPEQLFWVFRKILTFDEFKRIQDTSGLTKKEKDTADKMRSITQILSDDDFYNSFTKIYD